MIEVSEFNLYANGKIIVFDDGTTELDRGDYVIDGTQNDVYLTPITDDRLDKIAYEQYQNSVSDSGKRWWVVALANDIENPLDESEFVGREIVVPNILDFKLKN